MPASLAFNASNIGCTIQAAESFSAIVDPFCDLCAVSDIELGGEMTVSGESLDHFHEAGVVDVGEREDGASFC